MQLADLQELPVPIKRVFNEGMPKVPIGVVRKAVQWVWGKPAGLEFTARQLSENADIPYHYAAKVASHLTLLHELNRRSGVGERNKMTYKFSRPKSGEKIVVETLARVEAAKANRIAKKNAPTAAPAPAPAPAPVAQIPADVNRVNAAPQNTTPLGVIELPKQVRETSGGQRLLALSALVNEKVAKLDEIINVLLDEVDTAILEAAEELQKQRDLSTVSVEELLAEVARRVPRS